MREIKWLSTFIAGLAAGGTLGAGVASVAGPGDLIYQTGGHAIEITAAKAVALADAFIAAGAWDGARSDMIQCKVQRDTGVETGFSAACVGLKSAPAGSLPVSEGGVRVVGVAQ